MPETSASIHAPTGVTQSVTPRIRAIFEAIDRPLPPVSRRYGLAILASLAATTLTLALAGFMERNLFMLFQTAVLASALYGGVGSGITATLACAIAADWAFMEPIGSIRIHSGADLARLVSFLFLGGVITLLSQWLMASRWKARLRDAATAAEASARFAADASRALASSLDYETTLQTIARLAVDHLADLCIVDVLDEDGRVRRVAVAHADPEMHAFVEALRSYPVDPAASPQVATVLASGEPLVTNEITDLALRGYADDDRHLDILRRLDLRSAIVAPLVARGRPLGVIGFAGDSRRRYDSRHVALAQDLAGRAAIAVDNARLYREAQRAIALRDDVVRIVSHDLRNSLSIVLMSSDILLQATPRDPAMLRRRLEAIRTSAEEMNRLVHDLLDVARLEAGQLPVFREPTDVASLVDRAIAQCEPLAERKAVLIEYVAPTPLPQANADRDRIHQVLVNLLGNAIKFTPEGGRIRVEARADDDEIRLSITDTGPGIPGDQLPHVFDRFWQATHARNAGVGLGLAIARGIVEAGGGRIWVESATGQGSTFHFTLPIV
jgi:signal transduction histidine kinase